MRIKAKDSSRFMFLVNTLCDVFPELERLDVLAVAEGNVDLNEVQSTRFFEALVKMPNPDELCELV